MASNAYAGFFRLNVWRVFSLDFNPRVSVIFIHTYIYPRVFVIYILYPPLNKHPYLPHSVVRDSTVKQLISSLGDSQQLTSILKQMNSRFVGSCNMQIYKKNYTTDDCHEFK